MAHHHSQSRQMKGSFLMCSQTCRLLSIDQQDLYGLGKEKPILTKPPSQILPASSELFQFWFGKFTSLNFFDTEEILSSKLQV